MSNQQRILTGMRPTGQLHLGHYLGALENWIQMQHEYECFFLIADYQAMGCLLCTSPSPRDGLLSRMPSAA